MKTYSSLKPTRAVPLSAPVPRMVQAAPLQPPVNALARTVQVPHVPMPRIALPKPARTLGPVPAAIKMGRRPL